MFFAILAIFLVFAFISSIISAVSYGSAGLLIVFIIAIIMTVCKVIDTKANETAKYGWSPSHENYDKLSPERMAVVKKIRDDERIIEEESLIQMCRRQEIPGKTLLQRLYGVEDYYPSIKHLEAFAETLPPTLGDKLLVAAKYESREYCKKRIVFIHENDHKAAVSSLIEIMKECSQFNAYKASEAAREAASEAAKTTQRNTGLVEMEDKPYVAGYDALFD